MVLEAVEKLENNDKDLQALAGTIVMMNQIVKQTAEAHGEASVPSIPSVSFIELKVAPKQVCK